MKAASFLISFLFLQSFASRGGALLFSFQSQYDGYVHPEWKKKGTEQAKFFEDAVVVSPNSVVLGDGVGEAKGFSGILSNYQCLRLAEFLDASPSLDQDTLKLAIPEKTESFSDELGTLTKSKDVASMATTLVYLHLRANRLFSGVAGDSGYSLYRFNKDSQKLLLEYRSRELTHGHNFPVQIQPGSPFKGDQREERVEEGDVVFVASDGVLDVFPSSFITAAVNYLVSKMILASRNKRPVKDYDYDLADFLESYIHNLSQLAAHYKQSLKTGIEKEFKFIPLPKEEPVAAEEKVPEKKSGGGFLSNFLSCFGSSSTKAKSSLDGIRVVPKPTYPEGAEPLHLLKTNRMMSQIYQQEICNVFDPSSKAEAFADLQVDEEVEKIGQRPADVPGIPFKEKPKILNCFTGKHHMDSELKRTSHDGAGNWACSSIEDLTFPLHPVTDDFGKYHIYKDCVEKAIPSLPESTTPEEIANTFNSRYVSRNIGLAARFMSRDPRVKLDDFTLKMYYNHKTQQLELPRGMRSESVFWDAKSDDISVAAASIISLETFQARKIEQENPTGKSLSQHSTAIRELFEKISSRYEARIKVSASLIKEIGKIAI